VGIYEDYLDNWVKRSFSYLVNKVVATDIIFATCGGELSSIKLGFLLKEKVGCKLVINLHDPIDYTNLNGLILDKKPHVSRDKYESRYLSSADLIFTSESSYKDVILKKYPSLKGKIYNNYFGYISKNTVNKKIKSTNILRIAYTGSMGDLQKPEILFYGYQQLENKNNVEIYFIGDYKSYKPFNNIKDSNVFFIDNMPREIFINFMNDNIDVGFMSLTSDYLGFCVPSKLYEYLNLEIPIISALPDGDASSIISNNGYGISCHYDYITGIARGIKYFMNHANYKNIKDKIIKDKDKWNIQELMKPMYLTIKKNI
jgi:hypothetical protein